MHSMWVFSIFNIQIQKSDGDGIAHVHEDRVDALGHLEGLIYGVIHQLLTLHADDAVILALLEQADGVVTHSRGVHTVTQRGRAAALDMAQNGGTGVDAGAGLDLVGDLLRMTDALGHDDDKVALAGALGLDDLIEDVALHIEFLSGSSTAIAPEAMATFRAM